MSKKALTKSAKLSGKKISKLLALGYKQRDDTTGDYSTKRFKYVRNKSNANHAVWLDTKDRNRPIVNFLGTKPTRLQDLKSDLHIATGTEKYDNRFRNSRKFIEKIRKNGKEPTLVSHSLGGSLNEYAAKPFPNIKQINVNKGAGLGSLGRRRQRNQVDIRVRGDPVSVLSKFNMPGKGKSVTLANNQPFKTPLQAHTFSNVERLKRKV